MPVNSQLTTAALYEGMQAIKTALVSEPVDGQALIAALEADESGANKAKQARHKEILRYVQDNLMTVGGYVHTPVIGGGGTGYSIGDVFPVTGDGSGATVKVTSVAAGVIDGVEVDLAGADYYQTATVDTSGSGNGDATITVSIEYNQTKVVNDAFDNGDWTSV